MYTDDRDLAALTDPLLTSRPKFGISDDNIIPIRFRFENLAYLLGFLFFGTLLVLHVFYFLQGRWTNYMPSIEEAGADPLNGMIYSGAFSVIAFLSFLLLHTFVIWGQVHGIFKAKFIAFGQVFSLLCPISLAVSSNFRADDSLSSVYFGTVPFVFLSLIFIVVVWVKLFPTGGTALRVARAFLIFCAAASVLFYYVPLGDEWANQCTRCSICELVFFVSVILFFVTLKSEVGQVQFDLVVFAEEH
jgi:hypothetical protein